MGIRGYTRPLTAADDVARDVDQLRQVGVEDVTVETARGSARARSELLASLCRGDHVVVTSLERLASGMSDLIHVLNSLCERGVMLRCLTTPEFDLSRPTTLEDVLAVLAEYSKRPETRAAQARAPRPHKTAGRPVALDMPGVLKVLHLRHLGRSVSEIAAELQLGDATIRRVLSRRYNPR